VPSQKRASVFSLFAPENWAVLVAALVLLFSAIQRIPRALCIRNEARTVEELRRVLQLQQHYFLKQGQYGTAKQIGFRQKYPHPGIEYRIEADDKGFVAFAMEGPGCDAFGDKRAGNQYAAVNASGMIFHGAQEAP
jgi:hypothetical protein